MVLLTMNKCIKILILPLLFVLIILIWSGFNPAQILFGNGLAADNVVEVSLKLEGITSPGEAENILSEQTVGSQEFFRIMRQSDYWKPIFQPGYYIGKNDSPLIHFTMRIEDNFHRGTLYKNRPYICLDGEWYYVTNKSVYDLISDLIV